MANTILFVFEGEKTEPKIVDSLLKFYVNTPGRTVVKAIYGSEIYSLFHTIANDNDLDLFLLLKDRDKNKEVLNGISKDDVSEIYLFFDYDAHAPAAADGKLRDMLEKFCEETDVGKLYISYPMVEAIRHIREGTPFQDTIVKCKENIGYKKISSDECDAIYKDVARLKESNWRHIIGEHCKKLNHLMTDDFSFPERNFEQQEIFDRQLEKHIIPSESVAVLSALPVFAMDYYGHAKMKALLSQEIPAKE
ncbi:hypothetical protein K7N18_32155 [Burkholderia arboris]|uniref:hypothetical protein n=1 Tax=Burkholderia arboris TaxID=488730 RepID=UPI001CA3CC31|nr:hypothetical protein [Burkholderia arboris]MBY8609475.1 hypothetical protein [Burkholderia arboris]